MTHARVFPSARSLFLMTGMVLAGAVAQADPLVDGGGGMATEAMVGENNIDVGVVRPQRTFTNAAAVSAGVGLRNRGSGGIELSGMPPGVEVTHARIYWNLITSGAPPAAAANISIQRLGAGGSTPATVSGTIIGTGQTPCWGGTQNTVYRAIVPLRVVNGNGTYLVTLPAGIPGRVDGASPWTGLGGGSTLPAYNGASIVAVFERMGARTLFFEEPLSGVMFANSLIANLYIPPASRTGSTSFLHMINSDGQSGNPGPGDSATLALEQTRVNGVLVSGRSSPGHDGDWNGAQGGRFTQLWDNAVRNVSASVPASAARARIRVTANLDCLVPVAAVLVRG
jgi:hypothetical protein